MKLAMYDRLTPWYHLLDPAKEHAVEAEMFRSALVDAADGPVRTLLELGAGAGHNGAHLKQWFDCTLTDLAPAMLDLSRRLNPECDHAEGDMRTLRLGRTFDAVLVHDAICYMTSRADLRACLDTAFAHLRPGGAALVAPDLTVETFAPASDTVHGVDGELELDVLEKMWDPDPTDSVYRVDYVFLARRGSEMEVVHDVHYEGLFDRATWMATVRAAGFTARWAERPIAPGQTDEVIVARRPG